MSINKIINGPYLLAPTTSQITIVWEMIQSHNLKLIYKFCWNTMFYCIMSNCTG